MVRRAALAGDHQIRAASCQEVGAPRHGPTGSQRARFASGIRSLPAIQRNKGEAYGYPERPRRRRPLGGHRSAAPFAHEFLIVHAGNINELSRSSAGCSTQYVAQSLICVQPHHGLGHGGQIVRLHEQLGLAVPDEFRDATDATADHGLAKAVASRRTRPKASSRAVWTKE